MLTRLARNASNAPGDSENLLSPSSLRHLFPCRFPFQQPFHAPLRAPSESAGHASARAELARISGVAQLDILQMQVDAGGAYLSISSVMRRSAGGHGLTPEAERAHYAQATPAGTARKAAVHCASSVRWARLIGRWSPIAADLARLRPYVAKTPTDAAEVALPRGFEPRFRLLRARPVLGPLDDGSVFERLALDVP